MNRFDIEPTDVVKISAMKKFMVMPFTSVPNAKELVALNQ